ncbi:hypothetical protein Tco_0113023 [Tanacetum coccineum]
MMAYRGWLVEVFFMEKTKDDSCGRGDAEQNLGTHGYIRNKAVKFSPGYSKPGSFSFQSRSIAYGLVDKSPGSTHVEVSCEGYLEHDAETNCMNIANSTPFASMNNVNILCVNQGS